LADAAKRDDDLSADTDRKGVEDTALEGATLRDRTTHLPDTALVFLNTCFRWTGWTG